MNFIDTHSHLYSEEFASDIDQVLLRAKESKVNKILLPNIDLLSIGPMLSLCKGREGFLFPMLGLHPTSVGSDFEHQLNIIESYLDKVNICAIGEIGIDLYWDKTFIKEQKIAFEKQILWSIERNLPMAIHIRKGFDQAFEVFNKVKHNLKTNDNPFKGVFHCFSGDLNQANKVIQMGFKLGIGGVVSFQNAKLAEIVREVELKDILLETDAPYLAPTPYRGKRNESSYIPFIAQKIAQIKAIDIEEVALITTNTAQEVFSLQ
jgi:TatD DNase family protein